jgi:general nucleoside transport system permease protein
MNEMLVVVLMAQAVTAAVPIMLAGIGELCAQRAGVLNVGIEGLMLTGCIGGFLGTALSGNAFIGLAVAISAAAVLAALFAWATIMMRTDQMVAGMAINLLAVGGSGTAWLIAQSHGFAELPADAGFSRSAIPFIDPLTQAWLRDLPLIGPLLFDQYVLAPLTLVAAVAAWWMLRSTRTGLIIHALGDAPEACAAAGIAVQRWRFVMVMVAGGMAGAAGAYLSIMRTHGFSPMMTGGNGFVVLALVIFGRWRVLGLCAACLGFGFIDALQSHLQSRGLNQVVPYQLFQALPFIVALLALALMRRGTNGPRTLGKIWPAER